MNLSSIHHIAIIVSDYEAAKRFYVQQLGLLRSSGKIIARHGGTGSWTCG